MQRKTLTKVWLTTMSVILLIMVGLVTIPISVKPYGDTRMILEHTHQTYIAPRCFQQAETTNNLSETTLKQALSTPYKPESSCTEQALAPKKKVIIRIILEKLSLRKSEWDW